MILNFGGLILDKMNNYLSVVKFKKLSSEINLTIFEFIIYNKTSNIQNSTFKIKKMNREVIQTEDGSKTIRIIDLNENYHSIHGALQEANHVFMKYGLLEFQDKMELAIFEMGFGTGLNAYLTAIKASELKMKVEYHGVEAFPVSDKELIELDYGGLIGEESRFIYDKLHTANWDQSVEIVNGFQLKKIHNEIQKMDFPSAFYDIVFYDAFGPQVQEDVWSVEIFEKIYSSMKAGGFLVTYCAKGQVKRNLKAVGFTIEELPGPPGKREMTRAWKRDV